MQTITLPGGETIRAATREEMRELDRRAIEEYGIPGVVLMENAGTAATRAALDMISDVTDPRIVILCGRGNNGGDGFVIARHLHNAGLAPRVLLIGSTDKVGGDARINLDVALKMGIAVPEVASADELRPAVLGCDLIVDALLGTGLSGDVRAPFDGAIDLINESCARVLAVDIPSGLDANDGRILGRCVRADRTITFALAKIGFYRNDGPRVTGGITVADISIPRELL